MESKEYYYLNREDTKVGPMSLDALKFAPITPSTWVWNNSLPDWVEARSLPELADFFVSANVAPQSPPPPASNYNAGPAYSNPDRPPMPENYLIWAILATILCCIPPGIVSIIFSTKVSSLYAAGDYAGAQKASVNAKKWAMWTAIGSVIFWILYIIIIVGFGIAAGIGELLLN